MAEEKKDLPKMEGTIQAEILSPKALKETTVNEKNVLPSAEDLKSEKTHESLLKGVETFTPDNLKKVKTAEPASPLDVAKTEYARQASAKELENFDKSGLKHTETQEKNPLPDKDAIAAEAEHEKFKSGIENFEAGKLKKVETVEKNPLPTKEVIEQEKSA